MPSLFDIGRSGLQANRQSLAVTGQNIANVNTEGYKKRDAALAEVSGAGGGVTEKSDQTGLGVRVEEIRRAFDEFLLDKSRQTSSIYEKSDTFSQEVKDLENLLLPGDYNLSTSIGNYFNSLQEIAAAPDDQAPRIVSIEAGKDLASQFNSYSSELENLKRRIQSQAQNAVTSVNLLTKQLASINGDLLSSGLTSQASNAKLDQRDNLLDQVSQIAQTSVTYGTKGEATIRLGNSGSGPVILDAINNTTIDVTLKDGRLQPVIGLNKVATNQIQGGIIAGLTDAYSLADNTHNEIDNLAIILSNEFNRVNTSGLNLDGETGTEMFSVTSLKTIPNPTNRSTVGVEIVTTDATQIFKENYSLNYDANDDLWTLTSSNTPTITGKDKIESNGFSVSFFGTPLDGDEFTLSPTNESAGLGFLLTRPQEIAAASKSLISSSSSNTGTAELEEIALIASTDKTTINNIDKIFSNGVSPITSTEFSADGGAAIIPAGTTSIDLTSYIAQPKVQFGLSSSDVTSLTSITLTLANSSSVTVNLTGVETIDEVAEILNNGIDVDGSSHRFRTLGLFAAGGGSTLTINSNDQNFSTATVSTGSTLNGVITNPSVSSASNLQIFTREGRHIAGTVFSNSEIATFMTEENGFHISSEYRADYLNANGNNSYRNINLDRSTVLGNHIISYGANGTAVSAQRATSTVPTSPITSAYTLTVSTSNTDSVDIAVPIESSAGYVSGLINTNANNLGIEASALTRIKIPAPTSDGTVSFTLESKAGTNSSVSVSASVVTTDLTNLATEINNFTGKTGVSAYLSTDKKSIIMENLDGDDIQLTSLSQPGSKTIDTSSFSSGTTLTSNAHGFSTGDKIIYTAGGTAMTNLTSGNTYYAIYVSANTFKLASSSSNASSGTALTIGGANGSSSDVFSNPLTIDILKSNYSSANASVDVDGNSYAAARFSGELQLESSISISTTNDGGSTTVSSSQDALKDGYFELTSSVTGETKTLKPKVFDGDLSLGHYDGISASSSILSYGLTLPQTGTGTAFTTTIDASLKDEISSAVISKEIAEGLRVNSPSIEIIGSSISSIPSDGSSFKIQHDGLTYTLTMENGEVIVSGGEKDLISAFFEDKDAITVDTSSFSNTSTITSTEHGLNTGDAIIYNAGEKVTVDTTNFSSTTSITSTAHGFSTGDPIVYSAGGSLAINGLSSGTTYYAIRTDADTFSIATTSTNANNGTSLTITGGSGGSELDTFASPINGLTDGETYYVVRTDDHNFQIATTYALATNSSPSVITITGGSGGNASDTFDPGKNLYLSAGKTISASQFSFATDSTNETNAALFGMTESNISTTITGKSITTPSGGSTHFHIRLDNYSDPIGIFVSSNSKTINTSSISSSVTTLTSSGHGFKTGDKILYTAGGTALTGLTSGTSYFAKVIDANTFSLASTFALATSESPTLLSFGGANGSSSDTFATVYARALINDDTTTPASAVGISAEINQISDTNSQISIIKEADKNAIEIDTVSYSDGTNAESFGFYTNLTQLNVIDDSIKLTNLATDTVSGTAVDFSVPSSSIASLSGSNISISNLPPEEDLIILMTGSGARKIGASFGEVVPTVNETEYKVVIDSTNTNKLEILDASTLQSIATRLIPESGIITAVGKSLKFNGASEVNDFYTISNNKDGIGDNRNILEMIALQESDVNGLNSGSFQDIFNNTIAEIGTTVRSAEMSKITAEASRDEARALEDETSGVSMDEEASALMQFQQAYQANARILQTARELFDSLLSVIRS